MRINERCASCLYEKQEMASHDPRYLAEIRALLDNRKDTDTAPYMVYLFDRVYRKYHGAAPRYAEVKKEFNDLVLRAEEAVRGKIALSDDPVKTAFRFARIGNYIDIGAMKEVNEEAFLAMLDELPSAWSDRDEASMQALKKTCENGCHFLLAADNCGEIVLDRLFLEEIAKAYPQLRFTVLVRGGEILNDVTEEDARYAEIDRIAKIVGSGMPIAGFVYELMTEEAKAALDGADVILAKGQGNYESMSGQGRHIFYSFLCKCDLFTDRFDVPLLTGMFLEENECQA